MSTVALAIPIRQAVVGNEEIRTVNAREVHEYLEVGKDFSNWIKDAIAKYEFEENVDFTTVVSFANFGEQRKRGGSQRKDYFVSLDMGKELCMVSNTKRGREVRKYFIECEKKLSSQPIADLTNGILGLIGQAMLEINNKLTPESKDTRHVTVKEYVNGRRLKDTKFKEFVSRINERMRFENLEPEMVASERWGFVRAYPKYLLDETWLKVVA